MINKNIYLVFLSFFLLFSVACKSSDSKAEDNTEVEANAAPLSLTDSMRLILEDQIQLMDSLVGELENIYDEDSANEAMWKIEELVAELNNISEKARSLDVGSIPEGEG